MAPDPANSSTDGQSAKVMIVTNSTSSVCSAGRRLRGYRLLMADVYELAGRSRATTQDIAGEVVGQTAARWHVMSVITDQDRTVPAVARRLG